MREEICIVNLPGKNNYVVVTPNKIVYGLDASKRELDLLIREEKIQYTKRLSERQKDKKRQSKAISMGIIPTLDCNLQCIYCYSLGGDTKEKMSTETIIPTFKNIISGNKERVLKLNFVGGGEPFLHFNLISDIISCVKNICKKVEIGVVTNGTFNEDVINWMLENNVAVRISYDSIFHEKQRPFRNGESSRDIVVNNIKNLIAKNCSVTIQTIITNSGVDQMKTIIDELISLKIKVVKFEPALSTAVSRCDEEIEPNPIKYANALVDSIKYIADKNLDIAIDTGFFAEPSDDYYCGMPIGNMIITPHGLITSCVEVARPNDPYSSILMYGAIKNSRISLQKTRLNFLKKIHFKNQIGGCKICNLRLICHGGCPMANIWENGIPIRKSAFTCTVEHELLPKLLLLIAENKSIANVVIENPCIN